MNPKKVDPRLRTAVSRGLLKFWSHIAEEYPEILTGDLPPELEVGLVFKAEEAVHWWVNNNRTRSETCRKE